MDGRTSGRTWRSQVAQYVTVIAEQMNSSVSIENSDAGKSFEEDLARIRFAKNGLAIIIEVGPSDELWVEGDADAFNYAFSQADPFDGAIATMNVATVRKAYAIHVAALESANGEM